jgi:hypothetical protein
MKQVTLEIGPIRLRSRIAWAQTDDVPILLGRSGVIDRLMVTFNGIKRQITIGG